MRKFLLLGSALVLAGCQLFGRPETLSQWNVLDEAELLSCARWPLKQQDLQTRELTVLRGPATGILATGVGRNASAVHYYAPFDGDPEVDAKALHPLRLGQGAVVLGGGSLGAGLFVAVAQNAGAKTTLEIRRVRDNVVVYQSSLTDQSVAEGGVHPVPGGGWLSFRRDDNSVRVAYLDVRQPQAIALRPLGSLDFQDVPVILPLVGRSQAVAVWKDGPAPRPFKLRLLGENGQAGPSMPLDLAVETEVESFSAAVHGGLLYLAFVDGDSLVGQAKLRVATFAVDGGVPSLRWSKEVRLRDVHLSEPVFHQEHGRLVLMLLNWVDEESTIAQYKVSGDALAKAPRYAGIFPRGSRIMEAFTVKRDSYVIVRHRDGMSWAFQICRL